MYCYILRIFLFDTFLILKIHVVILALSSLPCPFTRVPSRGLIRVLDTFVGALHSGNACMNECPSVPHDSEQEEEKVRGFARVRRGELRGSFFFNGNGDEAGPFGPYVPICGPFPQAVRFDVVFFKAVFTKRASIPPFFRPQKWLRRSNMAVSAFPLSLSFSLSRVFPLFFFSSRRKSIAHSVAPFNLRRVLCGSLRLDVHPLRSMRERLSARETYRPHNRLM